jgi:hypothetical protein
LFPVIQTLVIQTSSPNSVTWICSVPDRSFISFDYVDPLVVHMSNITFVGNSSAAAPTLFYPIHIEPRSRLVNVTSNVADFFVRRLWTIESCSFLNLPSGGVFVDLSDFSGTTQYIQTRNTDPLRMVGQQIVVTEAIPFNGTFALLNCYFYNVSRNSFIPSPLPLYSPIDTNLDVDVLRQTFGGAVSLTVIDEDIITPFLEKLVQFVNQTQPQFGPPLPSSFVTSISTLSYLHGNTFNSTSSFCYGGAIGIKNPLNIAVDDLSSPSSRLFSSAAPFQPKPSTFSRFRSEAMASSFDSFASSSWSPFSHLSSLSSSSSAATSLPLRSAAEATTRLQSARLGALPPIPNAPNLLIKNMTDSLFLTILEGNLYCFFSPTSMLHFNCCTIRFQAIS